MFKKIILCAIVLLCFESKSQDTIRVELTLSPEEQAELDYNKGVEAAKSNSLVLATDYFTSCLAVKPTFEKALLNRSIVYNKLNKHTEALNDINAAILLNAHNPELFYNKSIIFFTIHQRDSQNLALDNCLKINGTHADAAYYKAVNCFQDKDFDRAIGFYSVAIQYKPNFVFALNDIGSCWRIKQKSDSAIYFYLKAIKADSSYSFIYNNLGSAYFDKKEYGNAEKAYTKALSIDKLNFTALINRGALFYETHELAKAQRDFEEVIAEKPNNSFAYNNLAAIALKNKDYQKAVVLSTRALELDSENGAAYYNRGAAYQMLKNEDGSCADWKKAYLLGVTAAKTIYFSTCSN